MKLKDITLISLALVIYAREDDTNKTVTSLQTSDKMYGVTSSPLTSRSILSAPEVGGQEKIFLPTNCTFSNSKQSRKNLESEDGDNKTQAKQSPENLKSNGNEHSRQIWRPLSKRSVTGYNKSSLIPGKTPTEGVTLSTLNNVFNLAKSSQVFTTAWQTLIMFVTSTSDIGDGCSQFVVYVNQSYKSGMIGGDESQMATNQSLHSISPKLLTITCQPCDFDTNKSSLRNYTLLLHLNKITANFTKTLKTLVQIMLNFDTNVSQIVITNTHNLTQEINIRNSCKPIGKTEFILLDHEDNAYIVVSFAQINIFYPLTTNGYKLELVVAASEERRLQYDETVYLCAVSDLFFKSSCRISSFNLNETSQNGSVLKIVTTEQYFGEDDYEVLGDKVFVCIQSSKTPKNAAYLLISFILSSISIICIVLMIIVHCLFQELRNLSGKMNVSLAWKTLFIVVLNLLSLLDLSHKYVCPVLAVGTHVIILAHFGWMSAIAVHMSLNCCHRGGNLVQSTSDEQMFMRYTIIVWGLSIVIVTPSVVLDCTHPDEDSTSGSGIHTKDHVLNTSTVSSLDLSVYPRYGFPFCTWFSGPMWTRLAFIIVPYFVSYIVSLGGFVFTLVGLHRSSKNPETIGKRSYDKTQCIIYITFLTLMDFSLISYILASLYPDTDVLVYVYTWFVLSQGVFLFMAFTMNKRVLSLISTFCRTRR